MSVPLGFTILLCSLGIGGSTTVALFAAAHGAAEPGMGERMSPDPPTPELAEQLRRFQQRYGGRTLWNPRTRLPARIVGLNAKIAPSLNKRDIDREVRKFMAANRGFLRVDPAALICTMAMERRGRVMVKYQQTHHGVPVEGAEVGLIASVDGRLTQYTSSYQPNIGISVRAKITKEQAEQIARKELGKAGQTASMDKIEMSIRQQNASQGRRFSLVYKVFLNTHETHRNPSRVVELDADTGAVIRRGDADPSRAGPGRGPG